MIGEGNGINRKPAAYVSPNPDQLGPVRKTDGQKQIPPGDQNSSVKPDNPIHRESVVGVPSPLTQGVRSKGVSSNNFPVLNSTSAYPERSREGGTGYVLGAHAVRPAQDEGSLESQKCGSYSETIPNDTIYEKLLILSFRQQIYQGIKMPGKGVMANDLNLQKFVKNNLDTINEINKKIQEAAGKAGNYHKECLGKLDQTDIQLPVSKTGKSRLTPGKMGFDMKLSDELLQEPFYQWLLQAEGKGLEIGSGYGELCLRVLANKNVRQLDCIEPQITQLLTIQARVKATRPDDLGKLALSNSSFPEGCAAENPVKYDFIICHRVFSVTPADTACKIIEQAYQQLKPGGRLFLLSLCDQHPDFQKNFGNDPGIVPDNTNGLIEVPAEKVLSDQKYNLPKNITFISEQAFARFLKKTGFNIKNITFPATTKTAGTGNEAKSNRNIAFVVQKSRIKMSAVNRLFNMT